MTDKVTVKISDREYTIKGADKKEQIVKVAAYVDKKMKEISESAIGLSDDRKAILTALEIAGDYFQLIEEKEVLLAEINSRSKRLIQNLDMTLE